MSNFPFNITKIIIVTNVQSEDHVNLMCDGPSAYDTSDQPLCVKFTTTKGLAETYVKNNFDSTIPVEVINVNSKGWLGTNR